MIYGNSISTSWKLEKTYNAPEGGPVYKQQMKKHLFKKTCENSVGSTVNRF